MGARKEQKLNFQTVSLNAILADHEIQSRVEVDMEWVNMLGNIVASGIKLPPIDVFRDPALAKNKRIYLLANGFHRVTLARKNGDQAIDAVIHEGDRREAILFSIGANVNNGKSLTNADRKKAAYTLLRDPEWTKWTTLQLAKKVGVAPSSITRWRAEIGLPPLEDVVKASGYIYKKSHGGPLYKTRTNRCKEYAYTYANGKIISLGAAGSEDSKKKFSEIQEKYRSDRPFSIGKPTRLIEFLASHGFSFDGKIFSNLGVARFGVGGFIGCGCLIGYINDDVSLALAVGKIVLAKRFVDSSFRCVILGYSTTKNEIIFDKLRDIDGGIEFMTPEDFVADLKAREGKS